MICPKCKNQLPDGVNFCKFCGVRFTQSNAQSNAQQRPVQQPTQKKPAPKKKKNKFVYVIVSVLLIFAILVVVGRLFDDGDSSKKDSDKSSLDANSSEVNLDSGADEKIPVAEGKISAQGNLGDSIKWTYYENGFLLFEGSGEMPKVKHNDRANWLEVKAVKVEEGITSIGRDCFNSCAYLMSIELPTTLKSIGTEAFYFCSELRSISIPEGVTDMGIGAFVGCEKLKEIRIPANVEIMGEPFTYCDNLEKIIVDPANQKYMSDENGILYSKDGTELQCFPAGKNMTEFTVPSSVTTIREGAFNSLKYLKKITIHSGVQMVRFRAFNALNSDPKVKIYVENSKAYTDANWGDAWNNCKNVYEVEYAY